MPDVGRQPASVIITAVLDRNRGIAKNGKMPHPNIIKHSQNLNNIAAYHPVIMGWNTALEIIENNNEQGYALEKLVGSKNIILSADASKIPPQNTEKFSSIAQAIQKYEYFTDKIFLIGGASVFEEALSLKIVHEMWLVECYDSYDCDIFFPNFSANSWSTKVKAYPKLKYRVIHHTRKAP